MINKILITSLCSLLTFGAFAEDAAPAPQDAPKGHGPHGGIMASLTEEQQACIKEYGCKIPEIPEQFKGERPELPEGVKPEKPKNLPEGANPDLKKGEKPNMSDSEKSEHKKGKKHKNREMTEEEKENLECMKKAMDACGIKMPERKEKPKFKHRPEQPEQTNE